MITTTRYVNPPASFTGAASLAAALPARPAAPRLALGPFVCAGQIRPGAFVYLYHQPDPSAPGGYCSDPAYRLHTLGRRPLSCSCPDKRVTHRAEPGYRCKHQKALAAWLALPAPAASGTADELDPFDCEAVIWRMTPGRTAKGNMT